MNHAAAFSVATFSRKLVLVARESAHSYRE